ncbi:MAG: hypothetical protein OHK0015_10270 [Chloroflexi bacterium OHK40]
MMTLDRDPAETPRWGVFTMHEQYGRPLVYRVGGLSHVGLSISSATGVAVICGWLAFAGPTPTMPSRGSGEISAVRLGVSM